MTDAEFKNLAGQIEWRAKELANGVTDLNRPLDDDNYVGRLTGISWRIRELIIAWNEEHEKKVHDA